MIPYQKILQSALFVGALTIATCISRAQDNASPITSADHDMHIGPIKNPQQTAPSFTLTLSAGLRDKSTSEFRAGSKVWITIVQKNLTNQPIDCTEVSSNGVDSSYRYDVRDEDGNAAEKVVRPHMELDSADIHPCNLAAGDSLIGETQISRVYKFDRPGKYVIQVSRFDPEIKDDQGNPLKVLSNTITITITG
jgi:hypothetical protein